MSIKGGALHGRVLCAVCRVPCALCRVLVADICSRILIGSYMCAFTVHTHTHRTHTHTLHANYCTHTHCTHTPSVRPWLWSEEKQAVADDGDAEETEEMKQQRADEEAALKKAMEDASNVTFKDGDYQIQVTPSPWSGGRGAMHCEAMREVVRRTPCWSRWG